MVEIKPASWRDSAARVSCLGLHNQNKRLPRCFNGYYKHIAYIMFMQYIALIGFLIYGTVNTLGMFKSNGYIYNLNMALYTYCQFLSRTTF